MNGWSCVGCGRRIPWGTAHRCARMPAAGPWLTLAGDHVSGVPGAAERISKPAETITAGSEPTGFIKIAGEMKDQLGWETDPPRPPGLSAALHAQIDELMAELMAEIDPTPPPIVTPETIRQQMDTMLAGIADRYGLTGVRRGAFLDALAINRAPTWPPYTRTEPAAEPPFDVVRYGAVLPVSDDVLMDTGVIPDTRPPAPPPSWRARLRRRWTAWRERAGRRVGSWLAGVKWEDE